MNKYYLRSIRGDGFGECVVPTEKFGRADHWNIESEMEHNNAYEAFMEYLSSLPVSALAHPDLAKKIGWVENYVEGYEGYYTVSAAWTRIYENEYVNKKPEHRRIVLFEKKQEQEMISNRIVLGKDDCYNRLLKALSYLCHLKKWKDEHGKDSHYEQFQPEAWAYAFDVLESMNEKITTPPVSGEPGGLQDETFLHYFREGYKYHRSFSEKVPYDEASEITVKKGFEQTRKQ